MTGAFSRSPYPSARTSPREKRVEIIETVLVDGDDDDYDEDTDEDSDDEIEAEEADDQNEKSEAAVPS